MLIGKPSKKPNLQAVRRIKRALHDALGLSEDAVITVAQLACLEQGCAPLETAVGLLRPGTSQLQHTIHKPTDSIVADDLVQVCAAWGLTVNPYFLNMYFNEAQQ